MQEEFKQIHQTPNLHFSICSSNREIFIKFEKELEKRGLIGFPDLQGNLHYIIDGRKGFPTAYKKMQEITLKLMEARLDGQTQKINKFENIADHLIDKYEFDSSLIGTRFLRYIVIYALLDKSLLVSLSNNLYPVIADLFNTSVEKVCYSIRYSFQKLAKIEQKQRKQNIKKEYFFSLENGKIKVNNRTSIHQLIGEAERIKAEKIEAERIEHEPS